MNNYNKKLNQFCNQFVKRDSREKNNFANKKHKIDSFHTIYIITLIKYYQFLIYELHKICFMKILFFIDYFINF